MPFLIAALSRHRSFLKITLDKGIVLCTSHKSASGFSAYYCQCISGFWMLKGLSPWLVYFQVASSTDSALNIEACTCNLSSFACVRKVLYMAIHISQCSDFILLCLYLQIRCTFAFIQQVCDVLAAICPAEEYGRSPRVEHSPETCLWFQVLGCASTYPCSLARCRARLAPLVPAAPRPP